MWMKANARCSQTEIKFFRKKEKWMEKIDRSSATEMYYLRKEEKC
jgi:hypothetical protein